jgi:uncharacterized protein
MQLDLSEIVLRPGMRSAVTVDEPGAPDADLEYLEPVRGDLRFQNGGSLLLIDGEVSTTLRLQCGRCLEPVTWPVTIRLEERFPLEEVLNPSAPPEEDEEWDTTVSSVVHLDAGKPVLDLDELIRQQLITELPLQVLCSESCRGLCPQCGANLNQGECDCAPDAADSPLAALGALLDEERNENGRC